MRLLGMVLPIVIGCSVVGCAEVNQGLRDVNTGLKETNNALLSNRAMASNAESTTETRIEVPNDPRVTEAFNAALPNIKRVLGIHKCIKNDDGMRLLNREAVPGVAMIESYWAYPNSRSNVKYHDRHKCMTVRAIDHVSMPALNALVMRVVYFADDSGETINFSLMFKKLEGNQWLLGEPPRPLRQ